MEPTIEIRVRDYCPIKREDLWACHRMTESEFLNLNQIGYVVGGIYRKLKHHIEAMKKQNEKNLIDAHIAKTKIQNKVLLESLDLKDMGGSLTTWNKCVFKKIWKKKDFLFFSWMIFESHTPHCTCTYCRGENKLKGIFNITLPECKKPNSWRIIHLRWFKKLFVLRFTKRR